MKNIIMKKLQRTPKWRRSRDTAPQRSMEWNGNGISHCFKFRPFNRPNYTDLVRSGLLLFRRTKSLKIFVTRVSVPRTAGFEQKFPLCTWTHETRSSPMFNLNLFRNDASLYFSRHNGGGNDGLMVTSDLQVLKTVIFTYRTETIKHKW